jgi:hypothetical protein
MIQAAEEESEAEVRRVDQDNINKFARLNARLHELRDERDLLKVRKSPLSPPLSLAAMVVKEQTSLIPDSVISPTVPNDRSQKRMPGRLDVIFSKN